MPRRAPPDNDIPRTLWIAADAARRISECEPLQSIEDEPLDALYHLIGFELQDRQRRELADAVFASTHDHKRST